MTQFQPAHERETVTLDLTSGTRQVGMAEEENEEEDEEELDEEDRDGAVGMDEADAEDDCGAEVAAGDALLLVAPLDDVL